MEALISGVLFSLLWWVQMPSTHPSVAKSSPHLCVRHKPAAKRTRQKHATLCSARNITGGRTSTWGSDNWCNTRRPKDQCQQGGGDVNAKQSVKLGEEQISITIESINQDDLKSSLSTLYTKQNLAFCVTDPGSPVPPPPPPPPVIEYWALCPYLRMCTELNASTSCNTKP